uniref:SDR family NAD(P)-dependent oxidoreductase n=1 Tax=uncultured Limosilactobacillus sp. TaxID=2837629 RepID=UPI0025EBD9F0
MTEYFDLKGQVALVTGCSAGLGVQMAKALASQGANIVALARRKERVEAVAQEINDEFGVETLPVQCDITDTERVNAAVDEVLDHFGRIDFLKTGKETRSFKDVMNCPFYYARWA